MQLNKVALAETKAFSPFFLDYIHQKEKLSPFYHRFPSLGNFKEQIEEKSANFSLSHREVLVSALRKQYQTLSPGGLVEQNISSLTDKNTFCITTGHQLNIGTGPLYFIYKIVTVINTCKVLAEHYPGYRFVPVYWMASEDHDYDEIKGFRLYGKKYSWETQQSGAVGRFTTDGLKTLMETLPGETSIFREAYGKNKALSAAVRHYVHTFFGAQGLVTIDGDDHELKGLFRDAMRSDVLHNKTLPLVEETNASLESLSYKTQVYCRDINFFYLDKNLRARLERVDGNYSVVGTDQMFSGTEIEAMITTSPEKFSPNVILRPLYQETILPNLAYVGGPAEVIYWLQLKSVFDHHHTTFPILMPRNFALIVEGHLGRKLQKTGLSLADLFEEKNFLFNDWALKNARHNLSVKEERETLFALFEKLRSRAAEIDTTLEGYVGAMGKRTIDSLERIESKFLRAEKRYQSDKLRQIEAVKDALFPNGSLQERTDNFLNYYQQDPNFIHRLLEHFDPFDFRFNVLTYPA